MYLSRSSSEDSLKHSVDNETSRPLISTRSSSASLLALGADYDRYPSRTNLSSIWQSPFSSSSSIPLLKHQSIEDDPHSTDFPSNTPWYSAFPLRPDEKEEDDYLHNPDPIEDAKADNVFKFDRRGALSLCSLASLILGFLCLFVLLPVLSFTGNTVHSSPYKRPDTSQPSPSQILTSHKFQNPKAGRSSLVDPDTPSSARTRKATNGKTYNLVFSDEFNQPNRTFYPQDDQFWEAPDIWYGATQDLEWYDPDALTTKNGYLEITMDAFENHHLQYRSGMLQSWNKMCFKGGIIEASISLPGNGSHMGLWPGFWTIGNLARPGYMAASEGVWPYSYQECDAGITPNQSSGDGISLLPGMRLPSCTCGSQDHPSPGTGRGAPEIDIIEGSVAAISPDQLTKLGVASQSVQVAPFDIWYQPNYDFVALFNPNFTQMNTWRGGPFQEAVSGITTLNDDWYDNKEYQTYGFEYLPGQDGYVQWSVGSMQTMRMDAGALGPNGNIGARMVSEEPMVSIVVMTLSDDTRV